MWWPLTTDGERVWEREGDVWKESMLSVRFNNYFAPLRFFHANISWLISPGVWVTANLLKSPGLFSVFWFIIIMFEWSLLVLLFLSLLVLLLILWGRFQVHQLQLVSSSPLCSLYFMFSCKVYIFISRSICFYFYSVICRYVKVYYWAGSLLFVDYH